MYKRKKIIALFFAISFILTIFPNLHTLAAESTQVGRIINCVNSVNVRSGPSTGYSKLGSAPKDAKYSILGKSGSWYKIDYHGSIGYVSSSYIDLMAEVAESSMPGTQTGKIVNCSSGITVRNGPGTSYSKLGIAPKNSVYSVLGKSGSWYRIDYHGSIGYVSSAYISLAVALSATSTSGEQVGQIANCTSSVNVRSGPGTNYSKLGSAPKGTTYSILGKSGSYYIINYNTTDGYVFASYVLIKPAPVTSQPPVPTPTSVPLSPALTLTPTGAPTSAPINTPRLSPAPLTTSSEASIPMPEAAPNKIIAGYFASWAAYSGYTPDKIPAGVTHVNYAFAKIGSDLKITMGDTSIDPANFARLRQLKLQRPNLKTLISIGGWTWSDKFSDVALTDNRRAAFADSVVAFITQYGFDGVDLDWEYPVSGGLPNNITRPEDKTNFTLLLAKLREKLDTQGALDGRHYLLSFAGASGTFYTKNVELAKLADYVDFATVMTYDMHGPWDTMTDFNAPLYTQSENTPQYKWSCNAAVKLWVNEGFPKTKLIMGMPFYGVAYNGVTNAKRGLYQTFTSGSSVSYDTIKSRYLNNPAYMRYEHLDAQVPWLFNGSTFISFDDPQSISMKTKYIKDTGLAGAAIWELSQNTDGTLFHALYDSLQ